MFTCDSVFRRHRQSGIEVEAFEVLERVLPCPDRVFHRDLMRNVTDEADGLLARRFCDGVVERQRHEGP
jgi:hypothetical protein